uniref:C2H2-type domain-containing protein n=2 Tax=Clastoptera arizonana TaxID=38151 RepID=A0A1B6EFW5_9HEMI
MNHIAQYRTGIPHQLHHNPCTPIQNFSARFPPSNLPLPENVNVNTVMIPQLVNETAMQYHSTPLQTFLQPPPDNRLQVDTSIKVNEIQRKHLISDRSFQTIPNSNERQEHATRPPENCHDVNYKNPPNNSVAPINSPSTVDNRRFIQHCNQGAKNCLQCYNAMKGSTTVLKIMVDAATMTDQEEMDQVNWPSLTVQPTTKVAEYLTSLRQFLKLSTPPDGKKRLGDVRIVTSPDGSRLYCCPECHMAYPDKNLLEPHLAAHKIERRFICNVCGAGLKRKEHLDRHQLSHSEERPYSCSVCPKTFKRNEHLSRHSIIHSGHKAQVCTECGKAFYRRDHLRKHTQGHLTKRLRMAAMAS